MSQVNMGAGYVDLQARGSAEFTRAMEQATKSTTSLDASMGKLNTAGVNTAASVIKIGAALQGIQAAALLASAGVAAIQGDTEKLEAAFLRLPLGIGTVFSAFKQLDEALSGPRAKIGAVSEAFAKSRADFAAYDSQVGAAIKSTRDLSAAIDEQLKRLNQLQGFASEDTALGQFQRAQATGTQQAQTQVKALDDQIAAKRADLDKAIVAEAELQERRRKLEQQGIQLPAIRGNVTETLVNELKILQAKRDEFEIATKTAATNKADEQVRRQQAKAEADLATATKRTADENARARMEMSGDVAGARIAAINAERDAAIEAQQKQLENGFVTAEAFAAFRQAQEERATLAIERVRIESENRIAAEQEKTRQADQAARVKQQQEEQAAYETARRNAQSAVDGRRKREEELAKALGQRERDRAKFVRVGQLSDAESLVAGVQQAALEKEDPAQREAIEVAKAQLAEAKVTQQTLQGIFENTKRPNVALMGP